MANIHWGAVYARYQAAVHAASEAFAAAQEDLPSALVLDVRRAGVYEQARTMIPGARWCDPAQMEAWSRELLKIAYDLALWRACRRDKLADQ
jgi:superoxide dismutase, Fe-Mn family